ncbi:MAG TPA: tail fiber protein [Solirubrobacterales bacterium]|nr:tail fiber protein [Solirubrobacterales bacterium]
MLVVAGLLLGTTSATGAAKRDGSLAGLPFQGSSLFVLDGKDGSLVHPQKGSRSDRYRLTLRNLSASTIWFADRPRRDAGRLATKGFFAGWARLGFRSDPPNGALVVKADGRSHTMAVELRLRRYNADRQLARFDVRALGSLGGGLRHLNRALERRLPRSFSSPSLFIDNSDYAVGCTLGETQLMAIDQSAPEVSGMIRADGRLLPVDENQALYALYGNRFGGTAGHTFTLPKMSSPPGTTWYVCDSGLYPQEERLTPACNPGETSYWILPFSSADPNWLPADGWTLTTAQYPEYGELYAGSAPTFTLPNVTAPPGMTALTCVQSAEGDEPLLGQLDLFPAISADPQIWWVSAAGQRVSPSRNPVLYDLLEANQATNGGVPSLPPVGPGASYFIAASGTWPFARPPG